MPINLTKTTDKSWSNIFKLHTLNYTNWYFQYLDVEVVLNDNKIPHNIESLENTLTLTPIFIRIYFIKQT
ncbi:hypothetical protein MAH4_22420 [Sessilibacter sp. MAH4]